MTFSEIEELIKTVRADTQKLYELDKQARMEGSTTGLICFNPEVLAQKMQRSDRQILEDLLNSGAVIDGVQEYLAQLN